MYDAITTAEFKAYFVRDFPYGTDMDTQVLDADIQRAIDESYLELNDSLFDSQEQYSLFHYYLTAHYLVINIQQSSSGLSGSSFEWPVSSKGVGSVSVSMSIPSDIMNSPLFMFLSKTGYGARYLEMIWPLLAGQVFISEGATNS